MKIYATDVGQAARAAWDLLERFDLLERADELLYPMTLAMLAEEHYLTVDLVEMLDEILVVCREVRRRRTDAVWFLREAWLSFASPAVRDWYARNRRQFRRKQ